MKLPRLGVWYPTDAIGSAGEIAAFLQTVERLGYGGSDAFIDAMALWGDAAKVKSGLNAHFAAGATQVAIHPLSEGGKAKARDAVLAALHDT